ncbi:MAG: helix-turn-helix domain-containing protein [Nanoarchaeota archaeon]|nr:helix-turn-helix domain-containing protein [Nanoarchaeota archaeon]
MWTAKISFDASEYNLAAKHAKQENIRLLMFPLSWTYEKTGVFLNLAGFLYGEEKSKKRFIRLWRGDKNNRILDIEFNKDFFVATARDDIEAKTLYNKYIIFSRPIQIDENGIETMVVNSFEKKHIENLIKTLEKIFNVRIHYIKQEKIKNISVRAEAPDLTEKQKSAMNLAVSRGYYKYPRKTSIQDLAKISELGFSTFHAHLRKAEQKLMPFFFTQ